jgi:hypothetical protein
MKLIVKSTGEDNHFHNVICTNSFQKPVSNNRYIDIDEQLLKKTINCYIKKQ